MTRSERDEHYRRTKERQRGIALARLRDRGDPLMVELRAAHPDAQPVDYYTPGEGARFAWYVRDIRRGRRKGHAVIWMKAGGPGQGWRWIKRTVEPSAIKVIGEDNR